MNKGLPWILENTDELRNLIHAETDGWRRTKLQVLLLLKTRQARTRQAVAASLGVNAETVGDWITNYERGGLERMLAVGSSGGSASSLPDQVLEALKTKLADPVGFGSYHEIVRWVEESFGVETNYSIMYYTVTKKLGGRLAVARPTHIKKKQRGRGLYRHLRIENRGRHPSRGTHRLGNDDAGGTC